MKGLDATDLEKKLREYQQYYNESRTQSGQAGTAPVSLESGKVVHINEYRWQKHCRGLFQLLMAT
jgi:putative transposase